MTLPGATLPSAPFPGMAQDLKDTLQLPRTGFPMRAGLAQREPGRVAAALLDAVVQPEFLPMGDAARLALREAGPHRKVGARQVQRVL